MTLSGSGQPAGSPLRHGAAITALAPSRDGRTLFTAARDRTVRVWAPDGAAVHAYPSSVRVVESDPTGRLTLTADEAGGARLHRPGAPPLALPEVGRLWFAAFSPDGGTLLAVCGASGREVRAWRTADASELHAARAFEGFVSRVRFAPDGGRYLTTSWGAGPDFLARSGRLEVWDARTGEAAGPAIDAPDRLFAMAGFAPGGKVAAVSRQRLGTDVWAGTWDVAAGRPDGAERPLPDARADGATMPPSAAWAAVALRGGGVCVWDATTREVRRLPDATSDAVSFLTAAPDGRSLLVGHEGGSVAVYGLGPDRLAFRTAGHAGRMRGGTFTADGRRALTFGADEAVRQWDALDGSESDSPLAHPQGVWALALGPGTVTTGCHDGVVRAWRPDAAIDGTPAEVTRLVEKRTGLTLDKDGTVRALTADEWAER